MARPERVLLLGGGLIIGGAGLLVWTLGILAVTSTFTAVQRIVTVWRKLARTPAAQASSTATSSDTAREEEPTRHETPLQRAQETRPSIAAIFSSMRRPSTPSRPGRSANR
jgi:hypothetical protein